MFPLTKQLDGVTKEEIHSAYTYLAKVHFSPLFNNKKVNEILSYCLAYGFDGIEKNLNIPTSAAKLIMDDLDNKMFAYIRTQRFRKKLNLLYQ